MGRVGLNWAWLDWDGLDSFWLGWVEFGCWVGLDWVLGGLGRIGLGWIGLGWVELGWIGLGWIGFGWIGSVRLGWVGLDWVWLGWLGLG